MQEHNDQQATEPQRYNPAEIEPKWQARWDADSTLYAADAITSGKPKYFCLEMLPYPSGQLHAAGVDCERHAQVSGQPVL